MTNSRLSSRHAILFTSRNIDLLLLRIPARLVDLQLETIVPLGQTLGVVEAEKPHQGRH